MSHAILAISNWLHLMATVIWIGGIALILLVLLPGARETLDQPMITKLMGAVARRFTPLVNISILVIVLTGLALVFFNRNFFALREFSFSWLAIVTGKHLIVLLMIAIHFYRSLILSSKIERLSAKQLSSSKELSQNLPQLQRLSLNLVWVNLLLGMLVLLLSGIAAAI